MEEVLGEDLGHGSWCGIACLISKSGVSSWEEIVKESLVLSGQETISFQRATTREGMMVPDACCTLGVQM